jgi:glycosyltransferase involved in cell wall biosynthesis
VAEIVIFADHFPAISETFVTAEAVALRDAGHEVRVEALARPQSPDPAGARGTPVSYMADDSRAARLVASVRLIARHPLRSLRDLLERSRWRREEEVRPLRRVAPLALRTSGHVHAHFAGPAALDAMRVARLRGLPFSLATHGYDIFQSPANLREKHEAAAFAVTACEYSAAYLREIAPDAHIEPIVVGVDPGTFRRRLPPGAGEGVLAVARLVEKKGIGFLLEAAAALPDVPFTIVGDGPLRAELERRAGANVRFTGALGGGQVRELMERAAVLACPSVIARDGDRDTMPVVVKEALAMEMPVVASDVAGIPEMVRPEWGVLVPPGEPDALARALADVLARPPEQRAEMGRAGRAFVVEHCDVHRGAARLTELVRQAGEQRN